MHGTTGITAIHSSFSACTVFATSLCAARSRLQLPKLSCRSISACRFLLLLATSWSRGPPATNQIGGILIRTPNTESEVSQTHSQITVHFSSAILRALCCRRPSQMLQRKCSLHSSSIKRWAATGSLLTAGGWLYPPGKSKQMLARTRWWSVKQLALQATLAFK